MSTEVYLEAFSVLWGMGSPTELPGLDDRFRKAGLQFYRSTASDIEERVEGEEGQAARSMLEEVLKMSQVTDPCKEFLIKFFRTSLSFGTPASMQMPFEYLGIDIQKGKFGIFDPKEELSGIEEGLIDYHRISTSGSFVPELAVEGRDLDKRWIDAYRRKYAKDPKLEENL